MEADTTGDVTAKAGLTIDARDSQASPATISAVAAPARALFALGVLAMTGKLTELPHLLARHRRTSQE